MINIERQLRPKIEGILLKGKSILLLGPRQVGKTTLLNTFKPARLVSFIQPRVRQRYERDPSILMDEVEALCREQAYPLIIVDEVQKVPEIMDVVQDLIDRKLAQFILTGSSARKLKRHDNINLLPGRVIPLTLDPLNLNEIPKARQDLNTLLLYGSLPEILLAEALEDKETLLDAYVITYLEEEIRMEALVRNLGSFNRFLELVATESGYVANHSRLSQAIGVTRNTIVDYYQILEDCLIAERVEPYTKSKTRHKLSKSNKYYLFDLGVRRLAAKESSRLSSKMMGHLFEQYIGLELIRLSRLAAKKTRVYYWQDLDGPEVDWLLACEDRLLPIEVKYTDKPRKEDAKHLVTFLNEYEEASEAYIVCQTPHEMKIADNIYAIPWQMLPKLIDSLR